MSKRRGSGEGSIYEMSDGRWRAAVSLGWKKNESGEIVWKRKVITAATRGEVQRELSKVLNDQNRGLPIDPQKQTVTEFLTAWLDNTVKPSVRPKTYRSYEQMVRNHLSKPMPPAEWGKLKLDDVPGLGALRLSKLSLQKVQEFFNQKLKAGNSPALVRYLRTVLRVSLNEAVKGDLLLRNPAALTTPPRVEKTEVQCFTPEQAVQFLKAAAGHRLEAMFTVALAIGLRSGEASALRWDDVDTENGILIVRHTLQRLKGQGLVMVPPKSEKSRRRIPLPAVCVTALNAHRVRQLAEREWAGSSWQNTGHVFTSTIGTPLDDRKVLREFTTLVTAAKLPKQRFHDLRHACISLLAVQGVPAKVVADIVGHSDIRLTQNLYQHVFEPAKRDAAEKMDALLNPVATSFATKPVPKAIN